MDRAGNTVKIKDIARALGISIGTVDRALHDRGRINALTKARVLEVAKTMGYRPNAAARALSSRRRLRVSVNLPAEVALYWDAVRRGIAQEAILLAASGIDIELRTFPRLGSGEPEAFEQALESKVSGIIMATGKPKAMRPFITDASHACIPVVAVACDAPATARLGVVTVDSLASGALAAELLGRLLRGVGKLAVVTGDLDITDHAEKFESFRDCVRVLFPGMAVLDPLLNHENESEAYEESRNLLDTHRDLSGLCISPGRPRRAGSWAMTSRSSRSFRRRSSAAQQTCEGPENSSGTRPPCPALRAPARRSSSQDHTQRPPTAGEHRRSQSQLWFCVFVNAPSPANHTLRASVNQVHQVSRRSWRAERQSSGLRDPLRCPRARRVDGVSLAVIS